VALRALIVDDSPGFRSSAAVLLRAGGVEIAGEASTGAEALDAVAALRPDVVLLDIRLPDGDGFAVCRRLVAAGIPVVLCSTRAARDYGDRVTASGATGFLLKERLSAAELLRLLGRG
jgi:DNA-binding NarL/FixJ family response regulator